MKKQGQTGRLPSESDPDSIRYRGGLEMKYSEICDRFLPSNMVMTVMLYDEVCKQYRQMTGVAQRSAHSDKPELVKERQKYEYIKSIFETTTGLVFDRMYIHVGDNPSARHIADYLADGEDVI